MNDIDVINERNITRASLMEVWRAALTNDLPGDPRDSVIAELSEYFHLPREEVHQRCLHWEDASVLEWRAKDRKTSEGLLDFYQTQTSWIFDTMWYHANQYNERDVPAESVMVAERLKNVPPGQHLDFGAGPGSASLFFQRLGWQVSLADISTTMLDFARWRFARHGVFANFYETSKDRLPEAHFDVITAFDVLVHVPNIADTLKMLHRSLKPNGYLIFNIDNQPLTDRTEWHLYRQHYPIIREVRRTGFRVLPRLQFFYVYQKVERTPLMLRVVDSFDALRYNQYVNALGNMARGAQGSHKKM